MARRIWCLSMGAGLARLPFFPTSRPLASAMLVQCGPKKCYRPTQLAWGHPLAAGWGWGWVGAWWGWGAWLDCFSGTCLYAAELPFQTPGGLELPPAGALPTMQFVPLPRSDSAPGRPLSPLCHPSQAHPRHAAISRRPRPCRRCCRQVWPAGVHRDVGVPAVRRQHLPGLRLRRRRAHHGGLQPVPVLRGQLPVKGLHSCAALHGKARPSEEQLASSPASH
jgi:hypothetical protein